MNLCVKDNSRPVSKQRGTLKKISFLTVVYPLAERYLNDFFNSMSNQTYKAFDLYIVNDGLTTLESYKREFKNLNICEINYSDTPPKIRMFGISLIKDLHYEAIIFGDCDDMFSALRVEKSIELLQEYDIVVNDMDVISQNGSTIKAGYLSSRIENRQKISLDFIFDKNIFGMTNTAIRADLQFSDEINDLIVTDWGFFTDLLSRNYRAVFTNETRSYYRQHPMNIIGIDRIDEEKILKGIDIKRLLYKKMAGVNGKYKNYYEGYECLKKRVTTDADFFKDYVKKVEGLKIYNPLWWEQIRLMEELSED